MPTQPVLPDELRPLAENALCARYYKDQDEEIRRLARKYDVSSARILRVLVQHGLDGEIL